MFMFMTAVLSLSSSPAYLNLAFTPHIYEVRTLKFEIKDLQTDLDKVQPPPQKKRRGKEKYQEFKFQN